MRDVLVHEKSVSHLHRHHERFETVQLGYVGIRFPLLLVGRRVQVSSRQHVEAPVLLVDRHQWHPEVRLRHLGRRDYAGQEPASRLRCFAVKPILLLHIRHSLCRKVRVLVPAKIGHAEIRELRSEPVTALAVDLRPNDPLHDVEERRMAQEPEHLGPKEFRVHHLLGMPAPSLGLFA